MGSKGGVTAPQARYLTILVKKCQNLFAFLPFPIYQAPGVTFVWPWGGGEANDSLGTCHCPPPSPPDPTVTVQPGMKQPDI